MKFKKVVSSLIPDKKAIKLFRAQEKKISHSKWGTFTTCRLKFYFSYIQGLKQRYQPIHFFVGEVFHEELERFYSKGLRFKPKAVLKRITDRITKQIKATPGLTGWQVNQYWKQQAILAGMLQGYVRKYKKEDKSIDVMYTEEKFKLPVDDSRYLYEGFIDMGYKQKKFKRLMDHKSTSSISKDTLRQMKMDDQLIGYAYADKEITGKLAERVVYNIVKKSQLRQGKNETFEQYLDRIEDQYETQPKEYFNRTSIPISPKRITEWKDSFKMIGSEIDHTIETKNFVQSKSACSLYGGCQYLDLCSAGINKGTLSQYTRGKKKEKK